MMVPRLAKAFFFKRSLNLSGIVAAIRISFQKDCDCVLVPGCGRAAGFKQSNENGTTSVDDRVTPERANDYLGVGPALSPSFVNVPERPGSAPQARLQIPISHARRAAQFQPVPEWMRGQR